MDFSSSQHSDSNDVINNFFDGLEFFRTKWIALNERCKRLEITLHEVETEKAQLQTKLELSRDYTKRVEKEKDELALIVQELHKELKNNSFHRWIDTLDQKLSSFNEHIKNPIVQLSGSRTTSEIQHVIDEIELTSSDEEDNSNRESFVNHQVIKEGTQIDSQNELPLNSNSIITSCVINCNQISLKTNDNQNQSEENANQFSSNESNISPNNIRRANNTNNPEIAISSADNECLVVCENVSQQNIESFNKEICATTDGKDLTMTQVANTACEITEKENPMTGNSILCDISAENQSFTLNETTCVSNNQISCDDYAIPLENSSLRVPVTENDRSHTTNDNEIISRCRELECDTSAQLECSDRSHTGDDISALVTTEKCSVKNVNFSENEPTLLKSSCQQSSTNDEIPSKNDLTNSYNSNTSVIASSASPETLPQLIPLPNVVETESATNVNDSTDYDQCCETNKSDPPQLTLIADNDESTYEKESIDSATNSISSPLALVENVPSRTSVKNDETSVENCLKISDIEQDVQVDSHTSMEFPQKHFLASCSKTLNERSMNLHISTNTVQKPCQTHLQFTSETLLQQGVNHEEVLPFEDAPLTHTPFKTVISREAGAEWSDESEAAYDKGNSANGDKSIDQQATPEELMHQVFGSPSNSSGHNSDVECLTEQSCMIDLNLSEEDEESPADKNILCAPKVEPELRVNLPRIFTPNLETINKSAFVRDMISSSERDPQCIEKDDQKQIVRSNRFCSSSSGLEPKSKRVSPNKLSEFNQDYIYYSNLSKLLICSLCKDDVTYGSYSLLDKHIISIHPNPYPIYFRCPYGQGNCERHFRTCKKLNDHVRQRHAEEDLSLPVDKLFPGQKPWSCPICEKIYARHNHLRAHLHKIHGENEAETDRIIKYKRKMHVRKNHSEKSMKKSRYSVGECTICLNDGESSENFKTYVDLDDHIIKNHQNPYPFYLKCPFCENENARHFKGLSWLNNHIANNHTVHIAK